MNKALVLGFLSFLIDTWALPAQQAHDRDDAAEVALPALTLTTLANFDGSNGSRLVAGVVQGIDGNFYGTTAYGGANDSGTVFKVTPAGKLITLYRFCAQSGCTDGANPYASLVQATNGNFYGTTLNGGANNSGTVFKMTPAGKLITLYSFCAQLNCPDGSQPHASLVQATNGNFYGTTQYGGVTGRGTVFKITPSGTLTTIYSFCAQSSCGFRPYTGLVQATDGNFYGTTGYGGGNDGFGYCYDYDCGTVFKITPTGTVTNLYSFCVSQADNCSDGALPTAGLVQATDGNFYGTTEAGGANGLGTLFKITPTGTRTTLYSLCSQSACTDGVDPDANLVQATDGNFYGTTYIGGANNSGTVFKITPQGSLTTLYNFCAQSACTDGFAPVGLVQATDGNFYGTTESAGTSNGGTVFELSVGLGPFVKTQPAAGKVGAGINILGTNLSGATSVTFNGTAATFTLVSPSLITATVPAGATTGEVKVIKPHGTVQSNVPFRVVQ
jgi:uncharacterized repeat protein (TIGR03803 family)